MLAQRTRAGPNYAFLLCLICMREGNERKMSRRRRVRFVVPSPSETQFGQFLVSMPCGPASTARCQRDLMNMPGSNGGARISKFSSLITRRVRLLEYFHEPSQFDFWNSTARFFLQMHDFSPE